MLIGSFGRKVGRLAVNAGDEVCKVQPLHFAASMAASEGVYLTYWTPLGPTPRSHRVLQYKLVIFYRLILVFCYPPLIVERNQETFEAVKDICLHESSISYAETSS